jgi:predicted nucleic acid-binding protein
VRIVADTNTLVSGDPKDLLVLAAAVAAQADAIVTGDEDLLSMGTFAGIPILRVRQALEKLGIPAE